MLLLLFFFISYIMQAVMLLYSLAACAALVFVCAPHVVHRWGGGGLTVREWLVRRRNAQGRGEEQEEDEQHQQQQQQQQPHARLYRAIIHAIADSRLADLLLTLPAALLCGCWYFNRGAAWAWALQVACGV
jgi:hypothetical protein